MIGTMKKIHIASDHAAFEEKNAVKEFLLKKGYQVVDHGPHTYEPLDDYPDTCIPCAQAVLADPDSLGVVMGGSGNGEQMAANCVPGIRAALAWSVETAKLAREHNNAQVISVGARMHLLADICEFVLAFIEEPFSGGERHQRRIDKMLAFEQECKQI